MSDSLHPFGQHFRTWRKRRGLSLKEAAGDIVSPQFLSQFERGQKNISLTIFSRLLISIGVDWTDFILDYSGDRVDYAFSLLGENPDPSLVPSLKEELADYYQDNPLLKDIFLQAILALNTIHDPLENHASPKLQQLIKQVCRQPHPNTMEGDLFVMYRRQFPLAYVLNMRDHYHEKLIHALEARDLTSVHNSLISLNMIVDYFTLSIAKSSSTNSVSC